MPTKRLWLCILSRELVCRDLAGNTAETWERGCEHATIRRRAESSGDISRHADKQHPVRTARPHRAERTAPGRWRRRHLVDLSSGPIRHHLAVRTAALEPASR